MQDMVLHLMTLKMVKFGVVSTLCNKTEFNERLLPMYTLFKLYVNYKFTLICCELQNATRNKIILASVIFLMSFSYIDNWGVQV